jgi:PAS domain S-box-containing protein
MSLNDFFRTDDPEALPIAAHRRALAGQSVTYVMEWQGNAYDSDVEPLYDDHGKVIGTVGVAVDITQLVRAETALQEREENFRQLAANASDGIIISAPAGRLLYVNPKAGVITGYAAEELLTVDFCRLIQDPIDAARLGRVAEELQESRSSPPTELLLTRKDGSAVHLEVSTAFTTWQGQPAVMHILRDITERKQAEYALREERDRAQSYLDIAGGIIIALDARGVVTLINRAGAAILGLTPDEVIGRDWYDSFVPEPTRAARRAVFNHLMAEKASGAAPKQVHEENAIVTRDGIKRIIAWHDTVIRDRQGRPTGMLSSGYDITERKQAEEEQERLIRELDAYAHTVAHDLNGPLSAVIGFAELLKQNERVMADADAAENITHIEASGNRIRNIIEELLLLASVRKTNVVARPVDMSRVVQAALGRLVFMIKEHKPKVVLPDVWPEALGHAPWLEEVWANYFSNAMKYGGRPPLLEVGGRALEAPFVLYWVKDNGPGLRPEEQQKLFLPFTRIHEDASTGHGLGLSIVRRIMDKLGGEVWLESTPGQGSKFGFILPAVKQASARSDDGGGHGRASRHPRPRKK